MHCNFQIDALDPAHFADLFAQSTVELAAQGIARVLVDKQRGIPCRISLQEAIVGEQVLLLTHKHHVVDTAYAASGPIFIRPNVEQARLGINETPTMLARATLSLRGYSAQGYLRKAVVIAGNTLSESLQDVFLDVKIGYIHIHYAAEGCYNCVARRVYE